MAKFIKNIHDRVNFATKKGLTGYHPPEKISDEVHAESMNLWRKYIEGGRRTKIFDVYLRPFQLIEVVPLNQGQGIFQNLDYVFTAEGIVPANFSKALIDNNSYGIGTTALNLSGTPGKYHWLEFFTATAAPATVTLKLDGEIIFSGQVTNQHTIVQFLYTGQLSISVIVAGQSITLTRSDTTIVGTNTEIQVVDDDKFLFRANHPVKGPTATYPVANIFKQVISVMPTTAFNFVILSLYRRPTKPIYAYTVVSDRYIYDDTNSIDFEWNESVHDVIMERTLSNLGINMRSPEMVQFAASQRKMEEAKM